MFTSVEFEYYRRLWTS